MWPSSSARIGANTSMSREGDRLPSLCEWCVSSENAMVRRSVLSPDGRGSPFIIARGGHTYAIGRRIKGEKNIKRRGQRAKIRLGRRARQVV
jgi:hypothetical protein